jgi:hypothetical protein
MAPLTAGCRNHKRRGSVGHPEPLRTIVDIALPRYGEVWSAGGHPHYVLPTSYDEPLPITGVEAAAVGACPFVSYASGMRQTSSRAHRIICCPASALSSISITATKLN